MVSSRISGWLSDAGLSEYAGNFAILSDEAFLSLLMSDYAAYGVTVLEHKQKLFRLIKTANNEVKLQQAAPLAKAGVARLDVGNELLDLDANDGDLLAHVSVCVCVSCAVVEIALWAAFYALLHTFAAGLRARLPAVSHGQRERGGRQGPAGSPSSTPTGEGSTAGCCSPAAGGGPSKDPGGRPQTSAQQEGQLNCAYLRPVRGGALA